MIVTSPSYTSRPLEGGSSWRFAWCTRVPSNGTLLVNKVIQTREHLADVAPREDGANHE